MRRTFCTAAAIAAAFFSYAQPVKGPVLVTDLLKIRTAGNMALTRDGSRAAFTVNSIEPVPQSALDYRYITQVYSLSMDGRSAPVQLTYAREGATQPAWSPDGKQLAFVRPVDGKPQIFILPIDAGEAWQLTSSPYGASGPKWSPDGKKIIFSSSVSYNHLLSDSLLNPARRGPVWALEKPGIEQGTRKAAGVRADPNGSMEEVRAYLEKNEADQKARVITKLNFQNESDISTDLNFTHFFLVTVSPGDRPRRLTQGFYRFASVDFLPDGKRLVAVALIDSVQHPDRAMESSIYLTDTTAGRLQLLLGKKGATYTSPRVSPDGKWLAYLYGSTSFATVPQLSLIPLSNPSAEPVAIPFDRAAGGLTWNTDGSQLYFTAQSNGGAPLYRLNTSNRKVEQLSDVNSGITSFDIAGNRLIFSKTEVADPSAVYVSDLSLKNPQKVGSFNEWVQAKQLSFPEKHSFVNDKGMTVEYWVMKPSSYTPGQKYPLLLEIHGGPSAMWGPGEAGMWHEFQYFCSKGYGVVYSNPRGSGGYGQSFLRGNINDWGKGPTSDVLTALDKTVAEGWADTSKLVITGGSYAGYLVAWIIAHDKRFKAACSQRGVYDLATFFGEGNAWRLVPNYFGGYPWEPEVRQVLNRESPINYVHQITTPYIIFHGDNDRRTGFVQSEMLYRSLKVLGRPVEYVRHPGATHEITRSGDNRQRIDQMLRTYEFFQRWIGTGKSL